MAGFSTKLQSRVNVYDSIRYNTYCVQRKINTETQNT